MQKVYKIIYDSTVDNSIDGDTNYGLSKCNNADLERGWTFNDNELDLDTISQIMDE